MKLLQTGSAEDNAARIAESAVAINALLLPVARDLIEQHTAPKAIARAFYAPRLAGGQLFLPHEVALAVRLVAWREASRRVHAFRAGALPLLLAALGFDVVCFERDAGLRVMAGGLLERLAQDDANVSSRFVIVSPEDHGIGPTPGRGPALALITDVVEGRRSVVRDLAAYDLIVIAADRDPSSADAACNERDVIADLCGDGYAAEDFVASESGRRYVLLRKVLLIASLRPPFHRSGDKGWTTLLPDAFGEEGDAGADPHASDVWLFQDRVAIGPPHAQHFAIRNTGGGRYSHWKQWLNFSVPDDSDPNLNGRSYIVARPNRRVAEAAGGAGVDLLADILKGREVAEIAYFHTDHFEPWMAQREPHEWFRALERFARLSRNLRFGRKLSLFYCPLLIHQLYRAPALRQRWSAPAPGHFRARGDGIAFGGGSPEFLARVQQHLQPLEREIGHEFHVHIHHEGWTRSNHVHPDIQSWMESRGSPRKDSRRLDYFVRLCCSTMADELGRAVDRWAFVHGNWSLNASDPKFCGITDEIRILHRHGCYGDFTFPAGESHCDPSLVQAPFTCDVLAAPRAYDRSEARPRPVREGAGDMTPDRFLVWNSRIKASRTSLDPWFTNNQRLFAQPEFLLRDWLADSAVIGNCLYIKTHAHSVEPRYRVWEDDSTIPHAAPQVQRLFDLLERVADRARVPVTPMTVNEVFARLTAFDRKKDTKGRAASWRVGTSAKFPEHAMSDHHVPPPHGADERTIRRAERLLLEAMPAHVSTDDGYYGARVARGVVLEPYEWEILEFALQHLDPRRVRFVEAGAGWGMLCILLAVAGFEVIALTGEPTYCAAMRGLAGRMDATFPNCRERLRIIEGFFPFSLDNALLTGERENYLISTNVIHEFTNASQDAFLAKAALCDRVILDTVTFARERPPAEREHLKEFLGHGFDIERSLWEDRLLLMKSKGPRAAVAGARPPSPTWLVGETVYVLDRGLTTQGGHCWYVELPPDLAQIGDSVETPRRSPLRVLEDGMLLGPPHSLHSDIASLGRGRYSHWQGNIYFSASDNTFPATNRRRYTLARAVI